MATKMEAIEECEIVKICRLCLKEEKFIISIFCDYGKQLNVQSNIKEFLNISISEDDSLSKYICFTCLSNLNFVITFVNQTKTNQTTLKTENEQNSDDSLFDCSDFQTSVKSTKPLNENILKRRINENFQPISKKLCSEYKLRDNLFSNPSSAGIKPQIKENSAVNKKLSELKVNKSNILIMKNKNINERKKILTEYFKQKCNSLKNNN